VIPTSSTQVRCRDSQKTLRGAADHPGIAHYIIQQLRQSLDAALLCLPHANTPASRLPRATRCTCRRTSSLASDVAGRLNPSRRIQIADQMAAMHVHVLHHKCIRWTSFEYAYLSDWRRCPRQSRSRGFRALPNPARILNSRTTYSSIRPWLRPCTPSNAAQWKEALAQQPAANTPAHVQLIAYWSRAVAAGHLHDAATAQDALKHGDEPSKQHARETSLNLAASLKDTRDVIRPGLTTLRQNLRSRSRVSYPSPDTEDKSARAKPISRSVKCSRNLLEMQKTTGSAGRIRNIVAHRPRTLSTPLGAAQAAEMAHQKDKATAYYAPPQNCNGSMFDRPELAQAKTLLAAK